MPIVPQSQQQNVLWPVRRSPRGWRRGTLVDRYESALRVLLLTPLGFLPWAPTFGTNIHKYRTQSVGEGDAQILEAELRMAISGWIPDIQVMGIELDQNPDDFKLTITVVWALPSVTPGAIEPILKPRKISVTY
jgi:phage baseplate assembly protein W